MSAWERAQEARNERRAERASTRTRKVTMAWDTVPPLLVGTFVQLMVLDGRAVLFGTTSSGDTLSVLVYDGGQKESYYIRNGQDIAGELANICDDYTRTGGDELLAVLRHSNGGDATKDTSPPEKTVKKD